MIVAAEYGELAKKRTVALNTIKKINTQLQKIDDQIKNNRLEALDFAVSIIDVHSKRLPIFFEGQFNLGAVVQNLKQGIEKDDVLTLRREQYESICHALNMINTKVFDSFTRFFIVNDIEETIQRIKKAAIEIELIADNMLEVNIFVARTEKSENEFYKVSYEVNRLQQMLDTLKRSLDETLESTKYEQQLEDRISSFKRKTRRGFFLVP